MKSLNCFAVVLFFLLYVSPWIVGAPLKLVTLEYPPFEYLEDGAVKGVAVELVEEVFRRMKYPISIQVLPWARSLKYIEIGEADGIFTAFKTPEREKIAYYSNEVLVPQVISFFVKEDSGISFNGDLNTLSSYSFGTVNKVSYGKTFDLFAKKNVIKTVSSSGDYELSVKMLIKGRFDILVSCKPCIYYTLKKKTCLEL